MKGDFEMKKSKFITLLGAVAIVGTGCSGSKTADTYYGRIPYAPETLNYLISGSGEDSRIFASAVEALFEGDNYGRFVPALAKDAGVIGTVTIEGDDYITFTVTIRDDAKWVDYKGATVANITAADFVAAAKLVTNPAFLSDTYWLFTDFIYGAAEYYDTLDELQGIIADPTSTAEEVAEATAELADYHFEDVVGVAAVDTRTVKYTFASPLTDVAIRSMLTYSTFLPIYEPFYEEQGDHFGTPTDKSSILYSGSHIIDDVSDSGYKFVKNAKYWDAKHVLTKYLNLILPGDNVPATWSRDQFEAGQLSSYTPTPTDEEGWQKYVTGANGTGTIENPVNEVTLTVDALHNVSSGSLLYNVDRVGGTNSLARVYSYWKINNVASQAYSRSAAVWVSDGGNVHADGTGENFTSFYAPNGVVAADASPAWSGLSSDDQTAWTAGGAYSQAQYESARVMYAQQLNTRAALRNKYFRLGLLFAYPRQLLTGYPTNWKQLLRNLYTYEGLVVDSDGKDYFEYLQEYVVAHWAEIFAEIGDELTAVGATTPTITAELLVDGQDPYFYPKVAKAFFKKAEAELGAAVKWPVNVEYAFPTAGADSLGNVIQAEFAKIINGGTKLDDITGSSYNFPSDYTQADYGVVSDYVHYIAVGYLSSAYRYVSAYRWTDVGIMYWGPDYADPTTFLSTYTLDGAWSWYMGVQTTASYLNPEVQGVFEHNEELLGEAEALLKSTIGKTAEQQETILRQRLNKLAEAEFSLIADGLLLPTDTYSIVGKTVTVTRVEPYRSARTGVGLSEYKLKWVKVYKNPITRTQYAKFRADWEAGKGD